MTPKPARRPKPRRATTGQTLVLVGDPLWDAQVRNVLSRWHSYLIPEDGERTPPAVLEVVRLDTERRLQKLVHDLEVKIGYAS